MGINSLGKKCIQKYCHQSIVPDYAHPFMTTVYPSFLAASSRLTSHVTQLRSSQAGVLNIMVCSMYSNDPHTHQLSPHPKEHLWDVV